MTTTIYLTILIIVNGVFSIPSHKFNLELNDDWVLFKKTFNKTYGEGEEELTRRLVWEDNLRFIQKHNLEYDLGKHTYTTGINQFSDLNFEKFKTLYLPNKFSIKEEADGQYYMPPLNANETGDTVDWRTKGFVTPVKNQGQCGSCWAFSATGSLEGQHFRKTGRLLSLSEQQLVDCSTRFGNNGCNGGWMSWAIAYVKAAGGIESEAAYPYRAHQFPCNFNRQKVVATATDYMNIQRSEIALANAVSHIGPISIAIDASHPSFQHYRSGVYYEPACSQTVLDHAVLIVGFGRDNNNKAYWIVKNSWGTTWGNKGYINMAKDDNNQCGVATMAGYPLV